MNLPQPTRLGAATRPTPPRRRRPTLHELVRDLAGWTLPATPATATRPTDGWALTWATRQR